jgi:hypothetical protein
MLTTHLYQLDGKVHAIIPGRTENEDWHYSLGDKNNPAKAGKKLVKNVERDHDLTGIHLTPYSLNSLPEGADPIDISTLEEIARSIKTGRSFFVSTNTTPQA